MGKNKLVRRSGVISFEKDEKKSIIIALVVSAVVVLATVVAIIAIKRKGFSVGTEATEETVDAYTVTENYTDDGSIIVTNQDELETKLAASVEDDTIGSITIQTDEEQSIEIPEGDYSQVALNIDAPYTEVSNYAYFNAINISQISANTWIEHGTGNNIILTAAASHVIVEADSTVESIANINYGSTLAVEIYGTVNNLSLEADESISSISVEGKLENLDIFSKTNLVLSGTGAELIPVRLQQGADGSVLKTSIPIDLISSGTVDLYMQEGSEASQLNITSADVVTNVNNNTTTELSIIDPESNAVPVPSGEYATFGEIKEPEITTSDSGSGSDSAVSSGSTSGSSTSSSSSSGNRSSSNRSSSSSAGVGVQTVEPTPTPAPAATTTTASPTPTPKPTPTPTTTESALAKQKKELESKVSEQNKTIANQKTQIDAQNTSISTLQAAINSLKESVTGLTERADKADKELEKANQIIADSNIANETAIQNLKEDYEKKIAEAAKKAVLDMPLDDSIKAAALNGNNIISGTPNVSYTGSYWCPAKGEENTDEDNASEFIIVKNNSEDNAYLVKLYYYYFNYSEDQAFEWVDYDNSKAVVIQPGMTWAFCRPHPNIDDVNKYAVQIVSTYREKSSEATVSWTENSAGEIVFDNEPQIGGKGIHSIQVLYKDNNEASSNYGKVISSTLLDEDKIKEYMTTTTITPETEEEAVEKKALILSLPGEDGERLIFIN